MSTEILLMTAVGLLVGIGIGFFIGRSAAEKATKEKAEMESELWQTKREVEEYRHQVNHHFEKAAELVGELTDSYKVMTQRYKAVYEHLAQGAQTLASREVGKKLAASTIDQLIYEANEDVHVAEKSAALPDTGKAMKKEPPPSASKPSSRPEKATPEKGSAASKAAEKKEGPKAKGENGGKTAKKTRTEAEKNHRRGQEEPGKKGETSPAGENEEQPRRRNEGKSQPTGGKPESGES